MSEKRIFDFKEYWGTDILRPYAEYSKRGAHYCIYCGAKADTREHVPSKVFLNKPFPTDLPTLPACQKCNNGFSSDELYTNTYIECLKSFCENNRDDLLEIQLNDRKEEKEARNAVKQAIINGFFPRDDRIKRILYKLSLGHIVYELFECCNMDCCPIERVDVSYVFKCFVEDSIWSSLESIEILDNEVLPEVGSRAFRNVSILEWASKRPDNNSTFVEKHLVMDWTDIQGGVYRYITFYNGYEIVVKMIIRDYLYAEVRFKEE